jgi:hypothetical protein
MNKDTEKKIKDARWGFEEELLDVIVKRDEFTTSDLQGIVSALIQKIMAFGVEIATEESIRIVKDAKKKV